MKNLSSESKQELEQLKSAYKSAKEARKLAKESYEAQLKALKAQLKSFKQAIKQAEKTEKKAKAAYKAFEKEAKADEAGPALEEAVEMFSETLASVGVVMEPKPEKRGGKRKSARPKAEKTTTKTQAKKAKPTTGGDDLTKVTGVGDKVADMLKANGITTFADMADLSVERYKELLKANGMSKFRNPTKWASEAAALSNMPAQEVAESTPAAPAKRGPKPKAKAPVVETTVKAKRGPKPKAVKAEAPVSKGRKKTTTTSEGDDLTKVTGVGDKVADMLKANGITTFADMAGLSIERYKELLKANGMSKFRNPTKWASEAAALANMPMAAVESTPAVPAKRGPKPKAVATAAETPVKAKRGPKPKAVAPVVETTVKAKRGPKPKAVAPVAETTVKAKRGPKPKAVKAEAPVSKGRKKATTTTGGDDLTKVTGVGDKVADMLKANGITTFADMAGLSIERYKELLKANGMSKFRNPTKWASEAAALANMPTPEVVASAPAAPAKRGPKAKAVVEIAPVAAVEPEAKAPASTGRPKSGTPVYDDLSVIKGVGPRVAEALNKAGITSYDDMAATSIERFQEILITNKMSKFRNPANWASDAAELAKSK